MKKTALLSAAAFLAAVALPGFAQTQNPPPPKPHPEGIPVRQPAQPMDTSKLQHFDLDFPGGTPAELAAAISKATGKHLNLIIPPQEANTQIIPINVIGVTVPELFGALMQASEAAIGFIPTVSPPQEDTVWAFQVRKPRNVGSDVCCYFPLTPFLENYSVEDITTAIRTGWKMLGADPEPKLSFHKETKLLIAVGAPEYVRLIGDVLGRLNPTHPKKTSKKISQPQPAPKQPVDTSKS